MSGPIIIHVSCGCNQDTKCEIDAMEYEKVGASKKLKILVNQHEHFRIYPSTFW